MDAVTQTKDHDSLTARACRRESEGQNEYVEERSESEVRLVQEERERERDRENGRNRFLVVSPEI